MKKYYVKDVPDNLTVISWLYTQSDWKKAIDACKPKQDYNELLCFKIKDFDVDALHHDIVDATTVYGDHGWVSSEGITPYYTGFSLVYNPFHIDNLNPHSSTLGTPVNSIQKDEFFWNSTQKHSVLKNSYFDGYGFNEPTPASGHKSLGTFMERCKRTRIRSRMSILNGEVFDEKRKAKRGWHKDELIFENLRVNIPITTSEDYLFQIEKHAPTHLDVGWAYSWDTNVSHRVFTNAQNDGRRIHLVLGFSPWWDYLPEEQAWVQNEFYGVKHPFDMLADGDVLDGLHLDTTKKIY